MTTKVTADLLLKKTHPSWTPILKNDKFDDIVEDAKNKDEWDHVDYATMFDFAKYPLANTKVVITGPFHDTDVIFESLNITSTEHNLDNWYRQGIIRINQHDSPYIREVITLILDSLPDIIMFRWGDPDNRIQDNVLSTQNSPIPEEAVEFIKESKKHWDTIKKRFPELWWNPEGHIGYTDGSCKNNQKPMKAIAGYGYHFTDGPFVKNPGGGAVKKKVMYLDDEPSKDKDPYVKSKSHKNVQENNTEHPDKHKVIFWPSNIRSEGYAILNLLKYILKQECHMSVTIHTDSQFWIDHTNTRIPKMVNRIEKGLAKWQDHKNHDICQSMWETVQKFKELKCPITLEYVPAHHDCLPKLVQDKKSKNYKDYKGNQRAEEIAEMCLPKKT
jgi:ribonuclease HI